MLSLLLRVALAVPTLNSDGRDREVGRASELTSAGSDAAGLEAWMPHMPPKGEVGTTTSDARATTSAGDRQPTAEAVRLGRRRSTAAIVGLFSVDRMSERDEEVERSTRGAPRTRVFDYKRGTKENKRSLPVAVLLLLPAGRTEIYRQSKDRNPT